MLIRSPFSDDFDFILANPVEKRQLRAPPGYFFWLMTLEKFFPVQ